MKSVSKMSSRERVYASLRREEVDRVPLELFLHPATTELLADEFEISRQAVDILLGNDIRQIWVNNNYAMEGITHDHDGESHIDAWGIAWERREGFNQITSFPFASKPITDITKNAFPYDRIEDLFMPMDEVSARSNGYFLGCDVSPCAFEMYCRLRGLEQGLYDIALEPERTQEAIGHCIDFSIALSRHAAERYPLDWVWTGDDVSTQQAMMMSPAVWREMIKPGLKDLFAVGKEYGLYIAYHCCGALRAIIPDLIEIGLDVLHPIQPNCSGMNPKDLKRDFGEHLSFIGGLDTQYLIPYGSREEVRVKTEQLIETMTSDGGGYILAASHTVPPETPVENIIAIYEAVGYSREYLYDKAADIRGSMSL